MIDLLNRFWIAIPIAYAITVRGLIAGFRRGGVPVERRFPRALIAGLPVMVCALIAWSIIVDVTEPPGTHSQFAGLNLLLGLIFIACASALTGSFLARRNQESAVERGTTLVGEGAPESSVLRADELTVAGHLIAPLDETKHFKMIGTTGTGKSTAIRELSSNALVFSHPVAAGNSREEDIAFTIPSSLTAAPFRQASLTPAEIVATHRLSTSR